MSVMSTSIVVGQCVCGASWDINFTDEGTPTPEIGHYDGCPAASDETRSGVRKIIQQVILQTLERESED